jgi:hypothetical protein
MKITAFWVIAPCSHPEVGRRFGGATVSVIALMMGAGTRYRFVTTESQRRGRLPSPSLYAFLVAVGGLVVIVLAVGYKVCPAKDDGFLRAIKVRSTTSFGQEVKPAVPCRKILRHVKDPYKVWKEILRMQNSAIFSLSFSWFAAGYLCWLLPESSGGWLRNY